MKTLSILYLLLSCLFIAKGQVIGDSIKVEDYYRSFQFVKPVRTLSNASLVFVLHGSGGSGKEMMEATSGLRKTTSNENVIFVYADGYKNYWNECRKAASSLANKLNINEEAFFSDMIDYFASKYNINKDKVFAVGTSGGGHMCYKLAMTIPKKIRAITAIIANLPDTDNFDCVDLKIAVPVMIVNGTADPLNKYEGGMMQSGSFIMGNVRSTDRTFHYWSDLAGYRGDPVKTALPDKDPTDGKTIERYTYNEKGKPEVTLLKVIGGKHDYPNDIDVHVEAWEFFKRQL
ncbi:MAG TPA: poly(3-hydroxybutyrate) depolymerase [Chryseolinea sp.]